MEDMTSYIDNDKLFDSGSAAARLYKAKGHAPTRSVAAEIGAALKSIRQAHELISRRFSGKAAMPAACEWLLDNCYLALREGKNAQIGFLNAPRLRYAGGRPVIIELCATLVHAGQGYIDSERCALFLEGCGSVSSLPYPELRLFPDAMRSALIFELAKLCEKLIKSSEPEEFTDEMAAIFTSLRGVSSLDMQTICERADKAEKLLRSDPAGVYPLMDNESRTFYREQLSLLARRQGCDERQLAEKMLERAKAAGQHIGFELFPPERRSGALYISANILLTLFLSVLCGFLSKSAVAALLLLLPVSELTKSLLDHAIMLTARPRYLPRLELAGGVPDEGKTVCVISVLLSKTANFGLMSRRLEEFYLANSACGNNLMFGLLADLPAANQAQSADDERLISSASGTIDRLNAKYGGGFYLFTRPRTDSGEGAFSGFERKRGAVLSLAALIGGRESELRVSAGDTDALDGAKFILTLDSDTVLLPDSARKLIGAMLHPLNRPTVCEKLGAVTAGHGLIHPRMSTLLSSARATVFSRIFAGGGGCEPYSCLCGELYFDLYDRGGFSGKGIIDAKALLSCSEKHIPNGCVLSHDALEGAYLRGGYMSDAELSDSFPSSLLSYYRRQQRWMRGDWQNSPWIFSKSAQLPDIERWKLFDCLRRSLLAPLTFIAIFLGLLLRAHGLRLAACAALLALFSELLIELTECSTQQRQSVSSRGITSGGVALSLVRTLLRLWLLPYEAYVSLSAVAVSMWRMLISRKKLLEWETFSQTDSRKSGLAACFRVMWFSVLCGLALLLLSGSALGVFAGLAWILSPVAAFALSLPAERKYAPDEKQHEYLLGCTADIWSWFEQFCAPEDNWLPPDNYQEQPPVGTAHRSSPTNIGLALVSALAAVELGLDKHGRAFTIIENMLAVIEKLPKAHGHLLNWYDTRTLRPLEPRYISTVDSGNLCASLIALSSGLRAHGKHELAEKADALSSAMDFSVLYDRSRELFRIGMDVEKGSLSPSCYDLFESEARLTSYLAVARGEAPRKHWRRLSRAMLGSRRKRIMASWTGTMFEYLMPELFLPLMPDSLLHESAVNCVAIQRERLSPTGIWGISESAFFSLDSALSYRYKAHGCAAAALKRGQERELVIAPYASFLALAVDTESAVENLKKLEKLGVRGKYGFYEAIDYTPTRCRGKDGELVRCYMSHHLGMSMLAAANVLKNGLIRRWFMESAQMSAYSSLLSERVPGSTPLIELREPMSEKPERAEARQWTARGEGIDFENPQCCLLSNGSYSIMLSESGHSSASCGDMLIYRAPFSRISQAHGVELYLGGESLLPTPSDGAGFMWELGEMICSHNKSACSFISVVTCAAGGADNGEIRTVELRAREAITDTALTLSFEPVLADAEDYVNHPAFWRLGLEAYSDAGCLLLKRLPRSRQAESWLCLACDKDMSFSAQRGGGLGALSHPLVCASVPVCLKAGDSLSVRFALCVAKSRAEAYAGAQEILTSGPAQLGSMVGASAAHMDMSEKELDEAFAMLCPLWYRSAPEKPAASKPELWKYGISGDMPIICCDASGAERERLISLTKEFCLLRSCGAFADLAFHTDEGGEYLRPVYSAVRDTLADYGLEPLLGTHGGIRILPTQSLSVISRAASFIVGKESPARRTDRRYILPKHSSRSQGSAPEHAWDKDNGFVFYVNHSLPSRCWSNVLTNGRFSYLACDSGCGNMWYQNAREMRINRWVNDPCATEGPETLEVVSDKGSFSIFAADDGCPCRVKYGFGTAVWEKELGGAGIRCTCFIPPDIDARVMILELRGSFSGQLRWMTTLQLSPSEDDDFAVSVRQADSMLIAESSRSYIPGLKFKAAFSQSLLGWTGDLSSFLRGELNSHCGVGTTPVFAAVFAAAETLVLACGCCDDESLRALCSPERAFSELENTRAWWKEQLALRLKCPEKRLEHYMSGWAAYQTLACRLMARGSMYQSGGATGFRDQLQDAVNLMLLSPEYARGQILTCCAHQYLEGDVMHWWHSSPSGDKGVRTRCSDDMLWLVWAVCEYTEKTGDTALCMQSVSYLSSQVLDAAERDRYETPLRSECFETVYKHCERALEICVSRGTGMHGLLLFGSGDWNDGMDRVGGESVWLSWFFAHVARRFSELLIMLCKPDSERWRALSLEYSRAADKAWDGQWYLRGYWPDGEKLGSAQSDCCRIDSISQSWAALCQDASNSRIDTALDSALSLLYDRELGLVRLFGPPFSGDCRDPGYIKSYGAGFRENGGQYTHAAIWLALACLKRGRQQAAYDILLDLLPSSHDARRYMAEPFVLAADVYSAPGHEGEAGWSWYTGSSGWYFRVFYEELLGLKMWSGKLYIRPCLPNSFPGCTVIRRSLDGSSYSIFISPQEILINGEKYDGGGIPI